MLETQKFSKVGPFEPILLLTVYKHLNILKAKLLRSVTGIRDIQQRRHLYLYCFWFKKLISGHKTQKVPKRKQLRPGPFSNIVFGWVWIEFFLPSKSTWLSPNRIFYFSGTSRCIALTPFSLSYPIAS